MTDFSGDRHAIEPIDGDALDWVLRMAEPDADWDAFTDWLEGDPARSQRYDEAALALERVTRATPAAPCAKPVTAPVPPPVPVATARRSRRGWLRAAIAATLVGGVGLGAFSQRDRSYTVATQPGEQRTVALADGSSIVLAGGSRVRLDAADPRAAVVEAGEMLFDVRHDAAAPFRVTAGDLSLVDLGTVFDVRRSGTRTRVAVAAGAVMVRGVGADLRLDPGQAAVFEGAGTRREPQDPATIGGWREGLLTFSNTPMGEVADVLSRNLALRITAAPAIRDRPFNGTVAVAALRRDPALMADLLGVEARRDEDGWTLGARR